MITREGLGWILGKYFSTKKICHRGFQRSCRDLTEVGMWHLGTWASGGIARAGFVAGLDIKELCQPEWGFYSMNSLQTDFPEATGISGLQINSHRARRLFWDGLQGTKPLFLLGILIFPFSNLIFPFPNPLFLFLHTCAPCLLPGLTSPLLDYHPLVLTTSGCSKNPNTD